MAGGIDWFRWHHGSVTDPKFQLIAKKAGATAAEVLAVWAFLLEEASQADERGNPGEIDFESIDCLLGLTDGLSLRIYEHMHERGLFAEDGRIEAWDRRQPKREREDDKSTERVQAFRERKRQETAGNATKRQETPRGEESREEKNSPSLRSGEARATRLPKPFELPEEWRTFCQAERPELDPDRVAAKFSDFWHGKPGKAGTKLDWLATWRNWVREERGPRGPPRTGETPYQQSQRHRVSEFAPGIAKRPNLDVETIDVTAIASH